MDEPFSQSPIVVTIAIDTPQGSITITKTQQFGRRPNRHPTGMPVRPLQSLSELYKDAIADANPWVRRHTTSGL